MVKKLPGKVNVRLDKVASALVREAARKNIRSEANEASASLRQYYGAQGGTLPRDANQP